MLIQAVAGENNFVIHLKGLLQGSDFISSTGELLKILNQIGTNWSVVGPTMLPDGDIFIGNIHNSKGQIRLNHCIAISFQLYGNKDVYDSWD